MVPCPDSKSSGTFVNDYRVRLALERRQWEEAERLQRASVEWNRQRAATARKAPQPDSSQRHAIRALAMSLGILGHIQGSQGQPECAAAYSEAINLFQRIGDQAAEAIAAFNLGHAYKDISALRNLAQASQWYQRSYDLGADGDHLWRGKCLITLGNVAYERFNELRSRRGISDSSAPLVATSHLNAAEGYYQQALALLPPNAVDDLAVTHNQLGLIYKEADDLDRALSHYRESIRYKEGASNFYGQPKPA